MSRFALRPLHLAAGLALACAPAVPALGAAATGIVAARPMNAATAQANAAVAPAPPPAVPAAAAPAGLVPPQSGVAPSGWVQGRPGPWGQLEYQFIYLTVPDWILERFPMPLPHPRWCFPGLNTVAVRDLFVRAGLDPELRERLLADPRAAQDDEGVFTVYPSVADLESLSPAARDVVYHELSKSSLNPYHFDPITIPDGDLEAWLRGADLTPAAAALVRKLVYREGHALVFSDLRALLSHASSDSEVRRWVKALTRTRAVIAYLKLDAGTDLPTLLRYWSANYRRRDALPMLKAAAEIPGGARLDLTHLLPPFAAPLVYTYTMPDIERSGQTPNCHWTSLNFFNYARQNVFLSLKLASSEVIENYERAREPYQFGDVLFFMDGTGDAFHSCVYVADNLVFTKNGENMMVPWILTRFEDVLLVYGRKAGTRIEVFRRKWKEESL